MLALVMRSIKQMLLKTSHLIFISQVRFKLASSYSGRVLKHVYEDGQELESPEEKYPHSFVHCQIPPRHLEVEQLLGFEEAPGDQQGGLYLCDIVSFAIIFFSSA